MKNTKHTYCYHFHRAFPTQGRVEISLRHYEDEVAKVIIKNWQLVRLNSKLLFDYDIRFEASPCKLASLISEVPELIQYLAEVSPIGRKDNPLDEILEALRTAGFASHQKEGS